MGQDFIESTGSAVTRGARNFHYKDKLEQRC
jgi:hypothetical protein